VSRYLRLARLLAAAALLVACQGAKELRAQQSAGGVLLALKVLRDAGNGEKAKALSGLARAPCVGEGVCEVRDACRSAYALHVEGLTLTQAAKQQLQEGKALDAARLLGSAEDKLKEAGGKVDDCIDRAGALQRRYKL
jgi:hypothetical protein